MDNFLDKLTRILIEDKAPPRLITTSATSDGDMRVLVKMGDGTRKIYNYRGVPSAKPRAEEIESLARVKNKKWRVLWNDLKKFLVNSSEQVTKDSEGTKKPQGGTLFDPEASDMGSDIPRESWGSLNTNEFYALLESNREFYDKVMEFSKEALAYLFRSYPGYAEDLKEKGMEIPQDPQDFVDMMDNSRIFAKNIIFHSKKFLALYILRDADAKEKWKAFLSS